MTFGRVNASARNTASGCARLTSAIAHSQKRKLLVCGLSTRKARTPSRPQKSITSASSRHERAPVLAFEVERIDVLVLLRRVLGVLHRAVRPVPEPLRMLADIRMVGGALQRHVERDLDAPRAGRVHQPAEVLERAERRMDGGVTAFLRADRPGTARIRRGGFERVVRALALRPPDRVDRRQVQDVEPEVGEIGEPGFGVAKRPVAPGLRTGRARKQFVPGTEARALAIDRRAAARDG